MYIKKFALILFVVILQNTYSRQSLDPIFQIPQNDSIYYSIIQSIYYENNSPEPLDPACIDSLFSHISLLSIKYNIALTPTHSFQHSKHHIPVFVSQVFKDKISISDEATNFLLTSGIQQIAFFYNPICKIVNKREENIYMQSRDFNPITSSHERQTESLSLSLPTYKFKLSFAVCDVKSGTIIYKTHSEEVNNNLSEGLYEITDKLLYMVSSEIIRNESRLHRYIKSIFWRSKRL